MKLNDTGNAGTAIPGRQLETSVAGTKNGLNVDHAIIGAARKFDALRNAVSGRISSLQTGIRTL